MAASVGAEVRRDDRGVVRARRRARRRDDLRPGPGRSCRSEIDGDQRHVVLDDEQAGAELVADAQQQRAERLGLALGDAARRLVEQEHGRVGGRATQARSTIRRRAGRQLADELVAERAEAQQLDQLVDPVADASSSESNDGRAGAARRRAGRAPRRSARGRPRSSPATVSAGNSRASWNERPSPSARPAVGRAAR